MEKTDFQAIKLSDCDPVVDELNNRIEDFKIRFETLQQVCDLLSDLINNFEWSNTEKNQLVYVWTQVIKVYWSLCEKCGIDPLPKL